MNIVTFYRWWRYGLTWNGRGSLIYYAVRRRFITPASADNRCFMGSPVGPEVHCPRAAVPGSPWCKRHDPPARDLGPPRSAP